MAPGAPKSPEYVVGIGASAGGFRPLRALIARFTGDHASFLVAMHLLPTHQSELSALLARCTQLTVAVAEDGLRVRRNAVYVIPPNRVLTLGVAGHLRLHPLPASFPRRTIDELFRSLAEWRERALAVVLSGLGSDGMEGMRAVQQAGGLTLIQEPQDAEYPQMPRHAAMYADYSGNPEFLGDLIMSLTKRRRVEDQAV